MFMDMRYLLTNEYLFFVITTIGRKKKDTKMYATMY